MTFVAYQWRSPYSFMPHLKILDMYGFIYNHISSVIVALINNENSNNYKAHAAQMNGSVLENLSLFACLVALPWWQKSSLVRQVWIAHIWTVGWCSVDCEKLQDEHKSSEILSSCQQCLMNESEACGRSWGTSHLWVSSAAKTNCWESRSKDPFQCIQNKEVWNKFNVSIRYKLICEGCYL